MEPKPVRRTRGLYAWEITEAQTVFGGTLAYDRVRIREGIGWPDFINVVGRALKKLPPPGPTDHNAVTLFYDCNFPINLPQTLPEVGSLDDYFMDWLIHELMHAWQNQHIGSSYLFRALQAQLMLKDPYDFGGTEKLKEDRASAKTILSYNMEAQATIAQVYYRRLRRFRDVTAFEPYIDDIRHIS